MTNGEKYKTAKERLEAFRYFCTHHANIGCAECVLRNHTNSDTYPMECFAYWLDLEAPAEDPLPCPYCGSKEIKFAIVEDASDGYMATPTIYCRDCGVRFHLDWDIASHLDEVTDEHRNKLLAKWNNRVARAAKEAK